MEGDNNGVSDYSRGGREDSVPKVGMGEMVGKEGGREGRGKRGMEGRMEEGR